MKGWWLPQSLFARTALLFAAAFSLYFAMGWTALVWTVIVPAAHASGHQLAERVQESLRASQQQTSLPEGATLVTQPQEPDEAAFAGFAFSYYLAAVGREIEAEIPGSQTVVVKAAGPSEIWVRTPRLHGQWLRLTWETTRPEAPLTALLMMVGGAALVLTAAGLSARRLARPLASLARAAERLADGERIAVDATRGPAEVRSLALAFQSMSQRLLQLEGQRELMLAGVSHDLRSPLARIRVAAELLDERDSALAGEMTRDIEEMDQMIAQFLRYVRSNYHETPTPAVPDELIRTALTNFEGDERLAFELNAGKRCAIPTRSLHHIALNVIQNALEYGRSPVVVRSAITRSHFVLAVLDSGDGLSTDEWQRVIQPFERLAKTSESGHSGLGLAMVDRLVAACGGHWSGLQTASGFQVQISLPVSELVT